MTMRMENEHADQRPEEPMTIWGAMTALRRHTRVRKSILTPESETAPLLGNERAQEGQRHGGNEETSWEGHGDFAGLTWWHKPSVCFAQSLLAQYILTCVFSGILALISVLPAGSRSRWNHRTETQSHPRPRMSIVSRREIFSGSKLPFRSCVTRIR